MRKCNVFKLSLILIVAMFLSSCAIVSTSLPTTFISLSELEISEEFEGNAVSTRYLGIDFKRLFKIEGSSLGLPSTGYSSVVSIPSGGGLSGIVTSIFSFSPTLQVHNYALNDLLIKHPGYDVVVNPKYSVSVNGLPPFYSKEKVTVIARMGKIKKEHLNN